MICDERACPISFAHKVRIFSHDLLRCCIYIKGIEHPRQNFTKKLYSKLISTTQLMEDFLDFHGAKNNSNWYYYREMTAAVRHLSLGAYSQKHIANRLIFYDLPDSEDFAEGGGAALDFLNSCLMKLAPALLTEAERLGIPLPEEGFDPEFFPSITSGEVLDYDIQDENKDVQKKHIVKIASEFLSIAGKFDALGFFEPYDIDKIRRLVPDLINEVEVRRFEMLVHNLQSAFDSYVIHGGYRYGDRKLKRLRSYFSVVFHLLQMMGRLLHFYERHLHRTSFKNIYLLAQEQLSRLVDPETLLNHTINYGLFNACRFLNTGKELAREILNENIERGRIRVGIPVKLGFHSRPSLLVAKIVQYYGGQVELCIGEDRFDASSVLDIQWAGGKINKEKISEVVFEGDTRALKDIEILAGVNYGEDTMGKGIPLPKELQYLR
ncbi:MAG: HPr family phosphocarrier protein [Desulfobacterales bacterium]